MALRDFFKRTYYGRPGQRDFTEADLPHNRLQLFRDVFAVRRGSMVGMNFACLLFRLPAILWTLLNLVQLYFLEAEADAVLPALDSLVFSWLLVLAPLVAFTGPFSMGFAYVMRNWARDEHSFPFADFKQAVKENWKQGLVYGLLCGILPFAAYVCVRFYIGMTAVSAAAWLPLAVTLLAALLWSLCAPMLPTMIVTYRQGFAALLKNALLMTIARLPRALGIRLLTLAVPLFTLLAAFILPGILSWVVGAAAVLYMVILPAFNMLLWASHTNALCEEYLNTKIDGAPVNIGLHPIGNKEEAK